MSLSQGLPFSASRISLNYSNSLPHLSAFRGIALRLPCIIRLFADANFLSEKFLFDQYVVGAASAIFEVTTHCIHVSGIATFANRTAGWESGMANGIYISFRITALPDPATFPEGKAIPLLQFISATEYQFAVAIAKPKTTGTAGTAEEIRRNLLLASLLQSIGFEYDTNNKKPENTTGYDFYTLSTLTDRFNANDLLENVPDIPPTPDEPIHVEAPSANLKVKPGVSAEITLKEDQFSVEGVAGLSLIPIRRQSTS